MTKSATGGAAVFLCVALFAFLNGCSSDNDAPVYDTAANPHGLPAQACELIDAIEAGQLVHYDVITESFGRLYLENQELLENKHWKEIITRLGGKFHQRADELIKNGVQSYSQAAGFYILASFSAPDNTQLAEKAALFTTWKKITERVGSEYLCSPTSHHLSERLDFIRHFVFGDRAEYAFADQYLVSQMLDSLVQSLGDTEIAELSGANQALLNHLGLNEAHWKVGPDRIGEPNFGVVDYRVVLVGPDRARFELYIEALEAISAELTVQLSYEKVVSDDQGQPTTARVTRKFGILNERTAFSEGDLVLATTVFPYDSSLSTGLVSLLSVSAAAKSASPSINVPLSAEPPCRQ